MSCLVVFGIVTEIPTKLRNKIIASLNFLLQSFLYWMRTMIGCDTVVAQGQLFQSHSDLLILNVLYLSLSLHVAIQFCEQVNGSFNMYIILSLFYGCRIHIQPNFFHMNKPKYSLLSFFLSYMSHNNHIKSSNQRTHQQTMSSFMCLFCATTSDSTVNPVR